MKSRKMQGGTDGRKIHVTVPAAANPRLRIRCALEDVIIQDHVAGLISEAVQDTGVADNGNAMLKGA